MRNLADALANVEQRPIDSFGVPSAGKEAYAFAVLGFLTMHGVAGTIATCTGASAPSLLGSVTPGATPLTIPPPVGTPPTRLSVVGRER
jgi:anhydro-N-acetylmuramic acid kinase